MAGDELDPLFRGPAPGAEPWDPGPNPIRTPADVYFANETSNLDALAAARKRPTRGPYAYGYNMYQVEQQFRNKQAAGQAAREPQLARERYSRGVAAGVLLDELSRQQLATDKARIDGQAKEARESARVRAQQRVLTTRALTAPTIAGAGNQLVSLYADLWYLQKQLRERRRNILRVGRRGAAATRPLQPTAIPGRTGAKSTRPIDAAGSAASGPVPTKLPPELRTRSTAVGVPKWSPTTATPVGGSSTKTASVPGATTRSPTTSSSKGSSGTSAPRSASTRFRMPSIASWLTSALTRALPISSRRMAAPRLAPARSTTRSTSNPLIPAFGQLSAAASEPPPNRKCQCPPPKKKRAGPTCTNPVVSRTVKDGFLTIKRKLQCPPSKPK